MATVHPTAIVDPGAELDPSVEVGPYSVIGAQVSIGAGTRVGSHCVIEGRTVIGRDNRIGPFASLGGAAQDKKYAGEPTELRIGDRNTIREFCTFNRGTAQDEGITSLGSDNWVMAYVHLAHDCRVGDRTIFANNAQLAGHVQVGDWAILGGFSGVHQFCRIGAHSMVGMGTMLLQDVPPFMMVTGNPPSTHGFNIEGLKRRAFGPERIAAIKQMHRALYRGGLTLQAAMSAIEALRQSHPQAAADVDAMLAFLAGAQRGIVR